MNTTRTVAHIEAATTAKVGPMMVKRALPVRHLKQIDPFIFIDHLPSFEVKKGADTGRIDPHPHAGFEVVTYQIDGMGFHRDSKGNEQIARPGDINWMTSGKGIIHSEGIADELKEKGGNSSLMQTWINLPAAQKFIEPSFRHFASADLPEIKEENSWVKVLIGQYKNAASLITTHTSMYYYHVQLKAGTTFTYGVAPEHTAGIYVMDGEMKVLQHAAEKGSIVAMNNDGDTIAVKAVSDTNFIAFGGLPINEPMVSYGPFVMNDAREIEQAIDDYQTGKMGVLSF